MPPGHWYPLERTEARGSSAADAVAWFVTEVFAQPLRWVWVAEEGGTFTVGLSPTLYRVRLSGAMRAEWVFEERKGK